MAEEWIATWDSLDEAQRTTILATLQRVSNERAEADKDLYASNFGNDPKVEIRDVTRAGSTVTVVYMFHWWEYCPAQSGSDWNYHKVRSGTAVFEGDKLAANDVVVRVDEYIHEYDEKNYSTDAVLENVRKEIDESF